MFTNHLNPILLSFGHFTIRWYGLFLAIGVGLSVWIIYNLTKQKKLSTNTILDLLLWLIIGGLIGARLGYAFFYQAKYFLVYPLEIFFINHGGLSSHGLVIGLIIAFVLFNRLNHHTNTHTTDNFDVVVKKISLKRYLNILIIPIPLLAMFIRIGNFFNSEIIGRVTNLPWGVYFPQAEINPLLRHPVQLYEALLLLIIFLILFIIYKKHSVKLPPLFLLHLFMLLYFGGRFLLEFTKEFQIFSHGLTMGQWLSLPLIIWSIYWFVKKKNNITKFLSS